MRRRTGNRVVHNYDDIKDINVIQHNRNRAYYFDRIKEKFRRQHKKNRAIVVDVDSDIDTPDCVETRKIASIFKFKLYNKNVSMNKISNKVKYHLVFIPL